MIPTDTPSIVPSSGSSSFGVSSSPSIAPLVTISYKPSSIPSTAPVSTPSPISSSPPSTTEPSKSLSSETPTFEVTSARPVTTKKPTAKPGRLSTKRPSRHPTVKPTSEATSEPTFEATNYPASVRTKKPTIAPTYSPSLSTGESRSNSSSNTSSASSSVAIIGGVLGAVFVVLVLILIYAYYSLRAKRDLDGDEAEGADMELRAFPRYPGVASSPVKIFPEPRNEFDSELGEAARKVLMKYYGEQQQLQQGLKEGGGGGESQSPKPQPEKLIAGVNPMAKLKVDSV